MILKYLGEIFLNIFHSGDKTTIDAYNDVEKSEVLFRSILAFHFSGTPQQLSKT